MMFKSIEEANKIAIRIRKLRDEKKITQENYLKMCWQITKNIYKYEHLWIQEHENEIKRKNNNQRDNKTRLNKVSF